LYLLAGSLPKHVSHRDIAFRSGSVASVSAPFICQPDTLFDDDHNGHNSLAEGEK
jgi:hypothetical protein